MLRYLDTSAKQRNKELLYMFNEVFRMSEADLFGFINYFCSIHTIVTIVHLM